MVAALAAPPTRSKVRPHCGTASSRRYERRRPERTPLYKVVAEHLEGWLENRSVAEQPVSAHVERELRSYLTCGILCFGFGRARCTSCGQGFVVAFSCKGRGVCPSCNGRRMAQTAAHLVDRVIPPVPVRQWVVSVPKRLRGFLADRPQAVAALTRIFLSEIERLLCAERLLCEAAGGSCGDDAPAAPRPRPGAVSFLHRFGSAINRHVHLHACVTDGVFMPNGDGPPAFLPARPINQADLAALAEKVRRRVVRWFRMQRLLDADAAGDMLARENSGFSVDASVRITLIDRDVPSYFQSLEHLLRYCARPPFALERLSFRRGADGRIAKVRYVLPRHKAANWVGPGRGRTPTASSNSRRLSSSTGSRIWSRRRGSTGIATTGCLPRITHSGGPSRRSLSETSANNARPRPAGSGATVTAPESVATRRQSPARTTPHGLPGRNSWPGWGRSFRSSALGCGGDIRLIAFITDPGPIRKILTHLGEPLEPPPVSPARGPPTDWGELLQVHDDRTIFQASPVELPDIDIHSL